MTHTIANIQTISAASGLGPKARLDHYLTMLPTKQAQDVCDMMSEMGLDRHLEDMQHLTQRAVQWAKAAGRKPSMESVFEGAQSALRLCPKLNARLTAMFSWQSLIGPPSIAARIADIAVDIGMLARWEASEIDKAVTPTATKRSQARL